MDRKPYPHDLADEQWRILEPLLPPPKPGGRPRAVELREVVNGLLYVLGTGCPWRSLPHDLPPWPTVWTYFRHWRDDGTLDRVHDALRARVRRQAGRDPNPSAMVLDSQSVKTAEKGGRAASTLARRLRGASATLSSIPWD
jgi:putative transposase